VLIKAPVRGAAGSEDGLARDSSVELVRQRLLDSAAVKSVAAQDDELLAACAALATAIEESLRSGHKLLLFGNGGSSMDAGHLAAELVGRYYRERAALPAIALSDATASMTAIGNDYSFEDVFARQVSAFGQPGDVAVGMSTSGNSPNVVAALQVARERGLRTAAITGAGGGAAAEAAEFRIRIPSTDTPRIQECYMTVGHTICELVELAFVEELDTASPG
jgi:D-sedoheptulose 7-phosphate isomerase